jgi:hypothetical protein
MTRHFQKLALRGTEATEKPGEAHVSKKEEPNANLVSEPQA